MIYRQLMADKSDLVQLLDEYKKCEDKKYKNEIDKLESNKDKLMYFITWHSQKQFWYQEIHLIFNNFFRNVEILGDIAKNMDTTVDIEKILKDEFSLTIKEYNILLFTLMIYFFKDGYVEALNMEKELKEIYSFLNKEELKKLLDRYSCSYNEVRESSIKEMFLFTKPIIKTDKGKYIVSNGYLMIKLLSEGLYWLIREFYFKKNSREFTSEFGKYFEEYLKSVLSKYEEQNKYEKIEEDNKNKLADWLIRTKNFNILIEQKSALASIQIKTMHPNLNVLKKYLEHFETAIIQLDKTEEVFKLDKNKTIKMIVYYEYLYIDRTIKEYLSDKMNFNYSICAFF
jgi:hypothetical protein